MKRCNYANTQFKRLIFENNEIKMIAPMTFIELT